ncbi:MAG: hypothetical protein IBJ03_03295 [Gemmatimonadaceae bacterium]|nr:hypothetical protein [Gemmatimonadaceae bacterium]
MHLRVLPLLFCLALPAAAQTHSARGPYQVGFTQRWIVDSTRTYRYADASGRVLSDGPRPIAMNVWYPATGGGTPLRHGDYFDGAIPAGAKLPSVFGAITRALAVHHRRTATIELTRVQNVDSLDAAHRAAVDAFLEAPVAARRDARRAIGRFPLVIYISGAGASWDDNAALCERLASLGYVVVSSAWQRGDGTNLGTHDRFRTVEGDVRALIVEAARHDGADWTRVALIGHSAGAQSAIRLQTEGSSPARAALILDTTQDTWSLTDERWGDGGFLDVIRNRYHRASGTFLFATVPEAQFQVGDTLTNSERWYLTLPHLDHNDFIAQGIDGRRVRADAERRAGKPVTDSIETAAVIAVNAFLNGYVVATLAATLRSDTAARATLRAPLPQPLGGNQSRVEHRNIGESGPPSWQPSHGAPTPAQWRRLLLTGDHDTAFRILGDAWRADSTVPLFHQNVGLAIIRERLAAGDSLGARAIHQRYLALAPRFSNIMNAMLSWGSAMTSFAPNEPERAAIWYRYAVMLDPSNAKAREQLEAVERRMKR